MRDEQRQGASIQRGPVRRGHAVALAAAVALLPGAALAAEANLYAPPETVAFEDLDTTSDADQNDLVIRTNRRCRVDLDGGLLSEEIHLTGVAAGASRTNALVLALPAVPDAVTADFGSGPVALSPSQRITVVDDARDLFAGAPAGFVNTTGDAVVEGRSVVLSITWTSGPTVGGTCAPASFALERPDEGLVVDDTTTLASGQPLVARLPGTWEVPTERTALSEAYPDFVTWLDDRVATECTTDCAAADWYTRPGPEVVPRPSLDTTAPLLAQATCEDGVLNQDEAATDCGSAACLPCEGWEGDGSDGDLTVTTTLDLSTVDVGGRPVMETHRVLDVDQGTDLTLDAASTTLQPGDEVVVLHQQAPDGRAGHWEVGYVTGTDSSLVTLRDPLTGYGTEDLSSHLVTVARVPRFGAVTVDTGGVLTAPAFDGTRGGFLFFRADSLYVASGGRIDLDHAGFRGSGPASNGRWGKAGESEAGPRVKQDVANGAAGGGGASDCDTYACTSQSTGAGGGGASHGTLGSAGADNGTLHTGGQPGQLIGDAALGDLYLGAGGGGGAGGVSGPGSSTPGGDGGGLVVAFTRLATVDGAITADGQIGSVNDNCGSNGSGGGGGGAGGTVWLSADSLVVASGAISAVGGPAQCNGGGAGGDGRVRLDFATINGAAWGDPAADSAVDAASAPTVGYTAPR